MSKHDITRRESLKKIAVTAYAAPATLALLTADRATAQSAQCPLTLINNSSDTIIVNFSGLRVPPGGTGNFDYFGAPIPIIWQTLNGTIVIWTVSNGFTWRSERLVYNGTTGSDCTIDGIVVEDVGVEVE